MRQRRGIDNKILSNNGITVIKIKNSPTPKLPIHPFRKVIHQHLEKFDFNMRKAAFVDFKDIR